MEGKGWSAAAELKAGDVLRTQEGQPETVSSVETQHLDEAIKVYNMEIGDSHTYYVSEEEVLVHNECMEVEGGSNTNVEGTINNGQPLNNHRIVPDTEASSLPATKQTPNASADLLNPDGSVKQRRYYGADGKAEMDIDFNHTDDGTHEFPHIHIWDWTKKPPRQDSRR